MYHKKDLGPTGPKVDATVTEQNVDATVKRHRKLSTSFNKLSSALLANSLKLIHTDAKNVFCSQEKLNSFRITKSIPKTDLKLIQPQLVHNLNHARHLLTDSRL